MYSLAILLSVPLQLFPAVRIMEHGLFTQKSGKADARVKWLKNLFRFAVVMVCTTISWLGAADLDKFVALVGSFAWCAFFPVVRCGESLMAQGQPPALLHLSSNAPLQSLRSYTQTQDRGHLADSVWCDRNGIYHASGAHRSV
jgi:hypothetical protein